ARCQCWSRAPFAVAARNSSKNDRRIRLCAAVTAAKINDPSQLSLLQGSWCRGTLHDCRGQGGFALPPFSFSCGRLGFVVPRVTSLLCDEGGFGNLRHGLGLRATSYHDSSGPLCLPVLCRFASGTLRGRYVVPRQGPAANRRT